MKMNIFFEISHLENHNCCLAPRINLYCSNSKNDICLFQIRGKMQNAKQDDTNCKIL